MRDRLAFFFLDRGRRLRALRSGNGRSETADECQGQNRNAGAPGKMLAKCHYFALPDGRPLFAEVRLKYPTGSLISACMTVLIRAGWGAAEDSIRIRNRPPNLRGAQMSHDSSGLAASGMALLSG